MSFTIEMNFCRRCGERLAPTSEAFAYKCANGHMNFYNAGVAPAMALFNSKGQILVVERGHIGKGQWDLPGGFCGPTEQLEKAAMREALEEVGITPEQYTMPVYMGSDINTYHFGSEVVPVIALIFRADLIQDVTPKAGDDAAKAWFADLDTLDLTRFYSATAQRLLGELRAAKK